MAVARRAHPERGALRPARRSARGVRGRLSLLRGSGRDGLGGDPPHRACAWERSPRTRPPAQCTGWRRGGALLEGGQCTGRRRAGARAGASEAPAGPARTRLHSARPRRPEGTRARPSHPASRRARRRVNPFDSNSGPGAHLQPLLRRPSCHWSHCASWGRWRSKRSRRATSRSLRDAHGVDCPFDSVPRPLCGLQTGRDGRHCRVFAQTCTDRHGGRRRGLASNSGSGDQEGQK